MQSESPQYSPVPKPGRISTFGAMRRGFRGYCPVCGTGRLFKSYVKLHPVCGHCHTALDPYRADDAPAYFTILLVGHIIVPGMVTLESAEHPALWIQWALWIPLTLILTLTLLPRIKGAVIALQWALGIRRDEDT